MTSNTDEIYFEIINRYIPAEYADLIYQRLRQASEMEELLKNFRGTMQEFVERDRAHLIKINQLASLLDQIISQN
jgi:hypothetical protein